jgi:cap2 methyltransferase
MLISTNASLKMYELITQMRLIACESGGLGRVRAFCNAELPGAFIVAINHYVKTMCPETNLDWVGSSYYPEAAAASGESTILGDHYGIYAGNRDRWLMGPPPNAMPVGATSEPPLTGDLTDADVVAALADAVHMRFGVAPTGTSLYTSDAGIDVSADFNREEELTALLNYGQVLCGLLALAPGGDFVTKQFTFFTPFSRSLIALLAALFDEMYVVKPLTSRPANSEIYLVGKGFRGVDRALADALLDRLAVYRAAAGTTPCDWSPLLDPTLTADTDAALLRIARQLYERQQVAFLNEAADFYQQWRGRLDQLGRALSRDARRVQERWLGENTVRRIRDDQQLPTEGTKSYEQKAASVRILAKNLKSGQALDVAALKGVFPEAVIALAAGGETKEPVDVQFHLEHYLGQGGTYPATRDYLFINQEFLYDWDLKALTAGKAVALCKTLCARGILANLGVEGILTGFTSPDIRDEGVARDPHLVVHLAGLSWLKGTLEVLRGWFKHGGTALDAVLFVTCQQADYAPASTALAYWDSLGAERGVEYRGVTGLERKGNVYLARHILPAEAIADLANAAAVHLCPSLTEGWGHIVNNARAVGSVVITSDAPPMNELVDDDCGYLVATDGKRAITMGELGSARRKYYPPAIAALTVAPVDERALMRALTDALALSADERARLGAAVRRRYEDGAAAFTAALRRLVNDEP